MINSWEELDSSCKNCNKCKLAPTRNNVVIGEGNRQAKIVFIGEGPGAEEDAQGIPFVGKAGKLLNMALVGLGIKREEIYIANVVKCRPPGNRNPEKDGIMYMPTFHPAALLRDEAKKIDFWKDLKQVRKIKI